MRKKKWAAVVSVLAAAIAATLTVAVPAQAADLTLKVELPCQGGGDHLASITHLDSGDDFVVKDVCDDGLGARGTVYLWDDATSEWVELESAYNGNGAGGADVTFHYDVKEGPNYILEICTVDGPDDPDPNDCNSRSFFE